MTKNLLWKWQKKFSMKMTAGKKIIIWKRQIPSTVGGIEPKTLQSLVGQTQKSFKVISENPVKNICFWLTHKQTVFLLLYCVKSVLSRHFSVLYLIIFINMSPVIYYSSRQTQFQLSIHKYHQYSSIIQSKHFGRGSDVVII